MLRFFVTIFVILLFLLLLGCQALPLLPSQAPPASPAVSPTPQLSQTPEVFPDGLKLEDLSVSFLPIYPLEVEVTVRGLLASACHQLTDVTLERTGDTYRADMTAVQTQDESCEESPVPFERTFLPDIYALPAGIYSVEVNGHRARFELPVDNLPVSTPIADHRDAFITGVVWHDVCAQTGQPADQVETGKEGCIQRDDDTLWGNGNRDSGEPGIEGLLVDLGEGPCPSFGLTAATTDSNGGYTFAELAAGTYCVSIEPLGDNNIPLLIPGDWTFPNPAQGYRTIDLAPGEQRLGVNFGWDFQALPVAQPSATPPPECLDLAFFIEDVTVEDNTVFEPGEQFSKTWRIRNEGTCTWTTEYALVHVEGDLLGATSPTFLLRDILPGETVDISVQMFAPHEAGTFRGNWILQNAQGGVFGVSAERDEFLWVQIIVR